MKKAIIFDFDGTIADTVTAFARVFEDITNQPEPLTPELIQHLKSLSGTEFIRYFKLPKWKIPYFLFRGKRMLQQHMDGIRLHRGMKQLIRALHDTGTPLYIVSSNKEETIRAYLQQQGLAQYFEAISGSASPFGKARKLLKLVDAHDIDVAHSWCIGDETRDIIAAHAVGMKIVAVSWGFNSREALQAKRPDGLADTTTELRTILEPVWKQ